MENEKELDNKELDNKENKDNSNYIEIIKRLKENSVSKEEYAQILQENAELTDIILNGSDLKEHNTETPPKDLNKIKELIKNAETNLDGFKAVLEYRDEIIKRGGQDVFLPGTKGINKIIPEQGDIDKAENLANCLKHCVEYADGDAEVFNNELQRIMVDDSPTKGRFFK